MILDNKERWILTSLHKTICSGTYTEKDVLALLIVLREHAPKKSPVRELADFIAHRAKDRGLLKDFLFQVQLALRDELPSGSGGVRFPLYSEKEIGDSLNNLFIKVGLSEIDGELTNQITICIISLLQSVEVKTTVSCKIRKFAVGVSAENISLLGRGELKAGHIFVFPVLVAKNKYEDAAGLDTYLVLDRVVEVFAENGEFLFVSRGVNA